MIGCWQLINFNQWALIVMKMCLKMLKMALNALWWDAENIWKMILPDPPSLTYGKFHMFFAFTFPMTNPITPATPPNTTTTNFSKTNMESYWLLSDSLKFQTEACLMSNDQILMINDWWPMINEPFPMSNIFLSKPSQLEFESEATPTCSSIRNVL